MIKLVMLENIANLYRKLKKDCYTLIQFMLNQKFIVGVVQEFEKLHFL